MLLQRLPIIIAIALCAALSGSLYLQVAPFFLNSNTTSITTPVATNKPHAPLKEKQLAKTHNIASFKLFGDSQKTTTKPKPAPVAKELPKTNLRLVLTGVMTSKIPENASALIEGPDKETLNYNIEDKLPGGAILKQVFTDHVIIDRSGRLENLSFVEKKSIGIETYTHPDDEEQTPAISTSQKRAPSIPKTASNPGRNQGIKDRLSKLRKRMLKNRDK